MLSRAEFRPTHVRLLFDLYLKRVSNPEDAKKMFGALDFVYDGKDPLLVKEKLHQLDFPMQLDEADTTLYYAQLLMLEQEFNYGPRGCKQGKVQPPREFLMRFIRWVASNESQIDDVISTAVRNRPARVRYAAWDSAWITKI
jgi:transcription termination factor NusB